MNNMSQFQIYQRIEHLDSLEFISLVTRVTKENIHDSSFDHRKLASHLCLSGSALYRKIKSITLLSPGGLIRNIRLECAKELLSVGAGNISEIAYSIGFNNPKYFARCFKRRFGIRPTEFMNENCPRAFLVNHKECIGVNISNRFIKYVIQVIEENIDDDRLSVDKLARHTASSSSTLYRRVKLATGQAPMQLVQEIRLKKACELLNLYTEDISEVAFQVGYNNTKYFTRCFKNRFGINPSSWYEAKACL